MDMKKFICPFTKKIINDKNQIASFVRWNSRDRKISTADLKFLIYLETFGDVVSKEGFRDLYENKGYSLPDFFKNFSMSYGITQFLIKYHNCKKRTQSESCELGAEKTKKTNIERYGVDQTFKVKEFDDKRKASFLKRYGVENPFTNRVSLENIEDSYMEKYGVSLREKKSLEGKLHWAKKTKEEKLKRLEGSIFKNKNKQFRRLGQIAKFGSSLEKRVAKSLINLNYNIITQYRFSEDRFWTFDFYLPELRLGIEVNGDAVHANPKLYKDNDIIPAIGKTAKEIWEKDYTKYKQARLLNYDIVYIWENDMKFLSEKELTKLVNEKIKKYCENSQNNQDKREA